MWHPAIGCLAMDTQLAPSHRPLGVRSWPWGSIVGNISSSTRTLIPPSLGSLLSMEILGKPLPWQSWDGGCSAGLMLVGGNFQRGCELGVPLGACPCERSSIS